MGPLILCGRGNPITASLNATTGALTLNYMGHQYMNAMLPVCEAKNAAGTVDLGFTRTWNNSLSTHTWTYSWGTITLKTIIGTRRISYEYQMNVTSTTTNVGWNFRLQPFTTPTGHFLTTVGVIETDNEPPIVGTLTGQGRRKFNFCLDDQSTRQWLHLNPVPAPSYGIYFGNARPVSITGTEFSPAILNPGQSSPLYLASLRFDDAGDDVYKKFALRFPYRQLERDNRAILRHINQDTAVGNALNPNGWNWDFEPDAVDLTTPAGLIDWRTKMLQACTNRVNRMNQVGTRKALGIIFWWIEGNRRPAYAYLGNPQIMFDTAPELLYETAGKRIIDEILDVYRDAGYRVGFTLRPWTLSYDLGLDAMSQLAPLEPTLDEEVEMYSSRIQFCKDQFGNDPGLLFYIDSIIIERAGYILDKVFDDHPDVLILPERESTRSHSVSTRHRAGGSPPNIELNARYRRVYPAAYQFTSFPAFGVEWSGDPVLMAEWAKNVNRGDGILMNGHYDGEPGYLACKAIYTEAGY